MRSVENAVVDAGIHIFAPGQTYVGFSRVTELKGLHIINFDPSSIKSDPLAICKYNRLRKKYRPELRELERPENDNPLCLKLRSRDIRWACNQKNSNLQDDSVLNEFAENIWNIKGLPNNFNVSFIHVCLQSLFHSETIRKILTLHSGNDFIKNIFNQYVANISINIKMIAEYVSEKKFEAINQDPSEFLMSIFKKSVLLKNHSHKVSSTIICSMCDKTNTVQESNCILSLQLPESTHSYQLQEIIDYNLKSFRDINGHCYENHKCQRHQKNDITVNGPLLIIKLSIFNSNEKRSVQIKNVPNSKITVNENRYKVMSCIIANKRIDQVNLYTNVLRQGKQSWYKVDGSYVKKVSWPRNSKDAYLFFLERI